MKRIWMHPWVSSPWLLTIALCFGLFAPLHAAEANAPWQELPVMPELPTPDLTGHTDIDTARIWWGRYGPVHLGIPVLLLHGGFGSSNYFAHLIPALRADGRSVIVIDSRGHGRSTLGRAPLGYARMAADVIAVLDQLQVTKVDLVGWSDGGIIGLELAISHRDRLGRLFAFGANADPSGVRPGSENSPVFKAYLERAERDHARVAPAPAAFARLHQQVLNMWSTEPHLSRAQLRSISTPTTIADGQYEEAILPAHVVFMAQNLADANMMILPRVSHFAMLQAPDTFNDAVLYFLHHR
jgi:pimeloyl-ACP methyl ester carboxylesterase